MKKSFAIFIIVSLMLGSFLSVHPDKNGRMSYNSYSLEKEILYLLREEQFELLGNEGSVLDSNKIIYDVNNKEYTLSNVIKEGGRIIIRYSELNCNVCIDSLFSCIDNHLNKKEKQQIHILASYHNRNDLLIFKRINNLSYPIYRTDSLGISLENLNEPFIFVLNKDYSISHLFIPHKERPQDTRRYLNIVLSYIETMHL